MSLLSGAFEERPVIGVVPFAVAFVVSAAKTIVWGVEPGVFAVAIAGASAEDAVVHGLVLLVELGGPVEDSAALDGEDGVAGAAIAAVEAGGGLGLGLLVGLVGVGGLGGDDGPDGVAVGFGCWLGSGN